VKKGSGGKGGQIFRIEKIERKGSLKLIKIGYSRYNLVNHIPNNPPLRSAGAIFACHVKPEGSAPYFQLHDRE
jgi:hypothetical protein